jgi:serine/threonine-protein kinase HipA
MLPPFIVSLLPEGWLQSVLRVNRDERALLRSGKRYMSNIAIVENVEELAGVPADVLGARLADHRSLGVFQGSYAGPGRGAIEKGFEHQLAALFARPDTPRLSGVQVKAPMHLARDGTLSPATDLPFTHILKPAGTGGFEALPLLEWTGLELARAVGLPTPSAALVNMPDDLPPALLVERLDIREHADDSRLLAMEDMCSVLDLAPPEKYKGSVEGVARAVRALSTETDEDLRMLLKRVLFAWLIADGDTHLKNLALLKTARQGDLAFRTVRLAPVYDTLTTRVFPGLAHDRMGLKVGGKDDDLKRADFAAAALVAGMRATDATAVIDEFLHKLRPALDAIAIPAQCAHDKAAAALVAKALRLCRQRVAEFA